LLPLLSSRPPVSAGLSVFGLSSLRLSLSRCSFCFGTTTRRQKRPVSSSTRHLDGPLCNHSNIMRLNLILSVFFSSSQALLSSSFPSTFTTTNLKDGSLQ